MRQLATHAVLHLLRFDAPLAPEEFEEGAGPRDALGWLIGPDSGMHEIGLLAPGPATVWGALELHASIESARASMPDADGWLPIASRADERWHALLQPFKHWGDADWLGSDRVGPVFAVADDAPSGTPIVVTTSAGFHSLENFDIARAKAFSAGVVRVLDYLPSAQGALCGYTFLHPNVMREGMTVSVWRDEASLRDFAYKQGEHRRQLERHRQASMFDRSAFTRYRILDSAGRWTPLDAA